VRIRVNPRAKRGVDRAGDPLDGLVNMFDLGIVLSLAFMIAALSSLKLTGAVFGEQAQTNRRAPAGSVVVDKRERVRPIKLREGQRVIGRGAPVGTVYRLDDGRTVIVRKRDR
jgi:hypothetical protein